MATLKLKKSTVAGPGSLRRAPVRGAGSGPKRRPTLAQAQAERAAREAEFQAARPAPPKPLRPSKPRRPDEAPPAPAVSAPNTAFSPKPRLGPGPALTAATTEHEPGSLRLSKRMSQLGLSSRREADEWIPRGWVRVDGEVVAELGARVLPGQRITIDPRAQREQDRRVTVLLHKPVGYVSGQAEDGYEPAIVLVTSANRWREDRSGTTFVPGHLKNLAPAGRLDIDSTGLLVLTQDGRVAKQLVGEGGEVEKEYLVRVEPLAAPLDDAGLALLRHGLELDGAALKPARVEWVNEDQLRFVLTEGKKRQVRRMCEAVGLKVTGLKRVRIGRAMLGDLPAGQWRFTYMGETFA